MSLTPQVTYRGIDPSLAVENVVRARAARLDPYADRITTCRVLIEGWRRQNEVGRSRVRLTVALLGDELTITRDTGGCTGAKALSAAIRDAFDTAARLLGDETGRQPHPGRRREPLPRAHVRLVMRDQDLGLLEAADGREVSFHKDSLVNADFASLAAGTEVVYIGGPGDSGLRASAVRVVGPDPAA
jgi:hypothetical protein